MSKPKPTISFSTYFFKFTAMLLFANGFMSAFPANGPNMVLSYGYDFAAIVIWLLVDIRDKIK